MLRDLAKPNGFFPVLFITDECSRLYRRGLGLVISEIGRVGLGAFGDCKAAFHCCTLLTASSYFVVGVRTTE